MAGAGVDGKGGGVIASTATEVMPQAMAEPSVPGLTFFRRNLACGQTAFAGFWAVRAVLAGGLDGPARSVAICAVVVATALVVVGGLRRIGPVARPDFSHPAARGLGRRLTAATVAQLVGSVALGALIGSAGWGEWAVPSLVATIGLFLVVAGRDLAVALTVALGCAMTIGALLAPLILEATSAGTVLAAGTAALLTASGLACFRQAGPVSAPMPG